MERKWKQIRRGIYPIEGGLGAEHWGLGVGENWYDLQGASLKHYGTRNSIMQNLDESKYEKIESIGNIMISDMEVDNFCRYWERTHPTYQYNGANCQLFVKDFCRHFLNIHLHTQNSTVGNGWALS